MKKLFFVLLTAGLLSGCETLPFQLQTPAGRAALTEDQLIAQETQQRMAGRIESLELQINQLNRDIDTLRSQLATRCAAIEQKSESDKREMVSRLSGELDKLMKQTSAPAPAPKSSGNAYGIEHTVRAGETLYIISKAYGVSTRAIMEANKMQDAGRLFIGQKLIIPQ